MTKQIEGKHTPGPWYIKRTGNEITAGSWEILCQLDDSFIAQLYRINKTPHKEVESNAAFIVTACNSHYELLNMLNAVLDDLRSGRLNHVDGNDNAINDVQQVLLKAEGNQ